MQFPSIDIAATGNNIRRLRKERGFSVAEVSEELMVDRQAVYRWEYGKTLPKLDNCLALAHLFDVSVEDIVAEKGEAATAPYLSLYTKKELMYLCAIQAFTAGKYRRESPKCVDLIFREYPA